MTLTITYDTGALVMMSVDTLQDAHDAVRQRFTCFRVESLALCGVVVFDTIREGCFVPRRVATYRIAL